jgi:hypothetical protein
VRLLELEDDTLMVKEPRCCAQPGQQQGIRTSRISRGSIRYGLCEHSCVHLAPMSRRRNWLQPVIIFAVQRKECTHWRQEWEYWLGTWKQLACDDGDSGIGVAQRRGGSG